MIRIERGSGNLNGYGGIRLRYLSWSVPGARAAFQIVHGLGDHAARYDEFAVRAAERGLSTWALDLRGHGRSAGPRVFAETFATLAADVLAFRTFVERALPGDVPLLLFGHSMGGLLALRTLQLNAESYAGAVVSSPWLAEPKLPPAWKETLARVLLHVAPGTRIPNGIRAADISHDPAAVRDFESDPLMQHSITPALYFAARRAQEEVRADPGGIRVPVLFLLAGADRVVSTPASETFAHSMGNVAESETFPGLYHEVWNESDSGPVYRRLFAWAEERIAEVAAD